MPNRRQFLASAGGVACSSLSCCAEETDDEPETASARPDYGKTGMKLVESTPLADGFTMPAKWDKHEATIMVFPPEQNWKGYGLREARQEWKTVANTISEVEPVQMVVDPRDAKIAQKLLSSEIELLELPVNDGWARDTAPLFLKNTKGERRAAGFIFNGWGAKFPPFKDDALLKARLCAKWNVPMYPINVVAEGGGVLVDGEGTIITTEECLLHKNRNPGVDKATIERRLLDGLGAKKVIWLGRGLTPDPVTDGHIDGMAAYVGPGSVLLHSTMHKSEPNYKILADAKRRLKEATDAKGRKLEVINLPLAKEVGHMNFYICNEAVVVPTAGVKRDDDKPLGILREIFPERKVIGVSSVILAEGGGGVHCIT